MNAKKIYIMSILIVVCCVVYVNIQIASYGNSLENKESELIALDRAVKTLEENLHDKLSLTTKIDQSDKLGLIKPENLYYLRTEDIFALRQ